MKRPLHIDPTRFDVICDICGIASPFPNPRYIHMWADLDFCSSECQEQYLFKSLHYMPEYMKGNNMEISKMGEIEEQVYQAIKESEGHRSTPSELAGKLNMSSPAVMKALGSLREQDRILKSGSEWIAMVDGVGGGYVDWDGNLERLKRLYTLKIPCLSIGSLEELKGVLHEIK